MLSFPLQTININFKQKQNKVNHGLLLWKKKTTFPFKKQMLKIPVACLEEFKGDEGRVEEFCHRMEEATEVLKIEAFNTLERIVVDHVKHLTGFHEASIQFKEPHILDHYRNLQLIVKESPQYEEFSALEMGAGIQSAIVVALIHAYKELKRTGAIFLIEEPEVYLHPHARRYFYSLLRDLSEQETQVFFTTHSTEFVDLDHYENINIVRKNSTDGTYVCQGNKINIDPSSRTMLKLSTEFDSTRNELFFAQRMMIVEGDTEENAIPYLFQLKDIDINKESISIINARSVTNIKFFIEIAKKMGIPFVILMDSHSNAPDYEARYLSLNASVIDLAGSDNVFMMDPNFEIVFDLPESGDKIKNAVEKARTLNVDDIPYVINDAIARLLAL